MVDAITFVTLTYTFMDGGGGGGGGSGGGGGGGMDREAIWDLGREVVLQLRMSKFTQIKFRNCIGLTIM